MFPFLLVAGVVVLAVALFTFQSPFVRKLGGVAVLGASYLTGYFLSGSPWVGGACVSAWFLVPWVEILTRVRRLRLPLDKDLNRRRPPSRERFPGLHTLTNEIERAGFEFVDDTGWESGDLKQFIRVFYDPKRRMQATISLNEQHQASFAFLTVATRMISGSTWMTWNYPFAPTMKFSPSLQLNRATAAASFEDLLSRHEEFLEQGGFFEDDFVEQDPEALPDLMQAETREQIDHNLSEGIIKLSGEGTFRYSWRGLFYLWFQFVKDMVRLS